MHRLLESDG
jgi:uncharacterized protein YukE